MVLLMMLLTSVTTWAITMPGQKTTRVTVNMMGSGAVKVDGEAVENGQTLSLASGSHTVTLTPADGNVLQSLQCYRSALTTSLEDYTDNVSGPDENGDYTVAVSVSNMGSDAWHVIFAKANAARLYCLDYPVNSNSSPITFCVDGQAVTAAEAGQEVSFTLSELSSSQCWSVSSQNVVIEHDDDTHYHFTMPAKNVLVKATIESKTSVLYQIISNTPNGRVSWSGGDGLLKGGETVTLSLNANKGYEYVANSLVVKKQQSGEALDLTDNGNGSWSFTMPEQNVVVSASFAFVGYNVHFDANGGEGTMADQVFVFDEAQLLRHNAFTRDGYNFTGWNTEAAGSGTSYSDRQNVSDLTTTVGATVTLYAQWKAITVTPPDNPDNPDNPDTPITPDTYTVCFKANGGEGKMADQVFKVGEEKKLSKCTFTRYNKAFGCWRVQGDPFSTYSDEQTVCDLTNAGDTITLYVDWATIIVVNTNRIYFNANGGEGTMNDMAVPYNETRNISACTFTRMGYDFTGWNTKADGSGTSYASGQSITPTQAMTLYAQWTAAASIALTANEVGGTRWTTFCHNDANYQAGEGTTAFTVALAGTTLTLQPVADGIIPAGAGVILKSTGNISLTITNAESAHDGYHDNALYGTGQTIDNPAPGYVYVLNYKAATGMGFYLLKSTGTIAAGKAYLKTDNGAARDFIGFDGETTGVISVDNGQWILNHDVYDLLGRKAAKGSKGVYIIKGKKVKR